MSEQNKNLLRRYFDEAWNQGQVELLDELVAPHFVNHNPIFPNLPPGPDSLKPNFATLRSTFPDIHFTIEDMVSEGDKVVTRFTCQGTHQGDWRGIAPTGRPVKIAGIQTNRLNNGQIIEQWLVVDQLGMLQQMGAIPTPGA